MAIVAMIAASQFLRRQREREEMEEAERVSRLSNKETGTAKPHAADPTPEERARMARFARLMLIRLLEQSIQKRFDRCCHDQTRRRWRRNPN